MTTLRRRALLIASLVVVAAGCDANTDAVAPGEISPRELSERIGAGDPPFILDVRTLEEFRAGHIRGAVNIPHDELAARIDELAGLRTDEVVVHCERGGRARSAAAVLEAAGFSDLRDLDGHMSAWRDGGYPVE